MTDPDLSAAWQRILDQFSTEGTVSHQFMAFLRLARPKGLLDDSIVFAAPNPMTRDFLQQRVHDPIVQAFSRELGRPVSIAVTLDPTLDPTREAGDAAPTRDLADPERPFPADHVAQPEMAETPSRVIDLTEPTDSKPSADRPYEPLSPEPLNADATRTDPLRSADQRGDGPRVETLRGEAVAVDHVDIEDATIGMRDVENDQMQTTRTADEHLALVRSAGLNPKYTFDTFVIGASNRFAATACVTVAEFAAKAYNPLFVYGESGLGKTHLLHAIGDYAISMDPEARVRYVNSEEFTNDFINMLRQNEPGEFQRRYREVDFLLIDDIQFLQGKEETVEEFFHTFNTLHHNNKQVVITSDVPPKELSGFEDRLRSRFEWGLISDVQPPTLETRIAILAKKADQDHHNISDEVLEYIASCITTNIRELEGALIRVTAFATLNNRSIDLGTAESVLKDLVTNQQSREITAAEIMAATASYFDLTVEALEANSRSRDLVAARQVGMYLCRELTEMSLPKIGQAFGGRDHTTVMHAYKKIKTLLSERQAVYTQVTELTQIIKQQARI